MFSLKIRCHQEVTRSLRNTQTAFTHNVRRCYGHSRYCTKNCSHCVTLLQYVITNSIKSATPLGPLRRVRSRLGLHIVSAPLRFFTTFEGFFVSVGQNFWADAASGFPTLLKPAALRPNATNGKIRCNAHGRKLVHQSIRNAATLIRPLLTSVLQAAISKPKSLFRFASPVGNFHKLPIDDNPIVRKGDGAIGKHDPEQSRPLATAGTGAK